MVVMAPPPPQHNTNPFVNPQMQQLQQQQQQQQAMLHHSGYSMESEEGDIEDNRGHSLSSSKSNLSENSLVTILNFFRAVLFTNIMF